MTIREVVAVFDTEKMLDDAVFALETRGFDRAAFSLLASEETIAAKLGHRYRRVREMEDKPGIPRETFYSHVSRLESEYLPAPILASVGVLAIAGIGPALTVVVAAGVGAAFGTALGYVLHERHARRVQEQLARGGLLLWVNVRNGEQERTAMEVLKKFSVHDLHVHELQS